MTDKTANVSKYKVADIDMTVSASSKTYSDIYNALNQFISANNTIDKINENAKEAGYNLSSKVTVNKNDQVIGMIRNSRPVIRWAFQNDNGSVSEIFECDDKFVVAAVVSSLEEGYQPVEAVASSLRAEIAAQKKGDQIVADLKAKNLTSLESYAEAMGSKVDSVKYINFSTRRIAGIGIEPNLNAAVSIAQVDQLSEPVKGNNGVYVFKVTARNKDAKEYDEATEIRSVDASNAYRIAYQTIQSLVNRAEVEDNRIRFY